MVVLFHFQGSLAKPPYPLRRRSACHDCHAILANTEKEGFEPSRRFSRPTPFPGEPLRPAWVLLHGRNNDKYGEDGIRTHVPVKANGFQDRLVMTTSIPLRAAKNAQKNKCTVRQRKCYSNKPAVWCQSLFPCF